MRVNKPTLVIDGSSASTFVGLLDGERQWLAGNSQRVAPLEGLFPMVEAVFSSAGCQLAEVHHFVYCEGPGSVLGIRLCAMAIQTWGQLSKSAVQYFSYNSLELTAGLLVRDTGKIERALLIAGWKKNVWHSIEISNGRIGAIAAIDDRAVHDWSDGPLFSLPQRKGWQTVPAGAITLEYSPRRLPEVAYLLKSTKTIELYSSNMNTFQKWVPQRHRGKTENREF